MFLDKFTTINKRNDLEIELVDGILRGDERALTEFYKKFASRIYSYIRARVDNISDSEEILQDTLLATIEALRDYSGRSSLSTYIYGIANHKVIDYYRKKKIVQVFFSRIPEIGEFFSSLLGPEEEYDEKILQESIEEVFLRLKPSYKIILILKYVNGMSIKEISEKLSETVKMVESRLFRARKAFMKIYQKCY